MVGANADHVSAQEGNEVLHRVEGGFVKGRGVQVMGKAYGGAGPQPYVLAVPRFVAQQ